MFDRCEVIFGCTGSDITKNLTDTVRECGMIGRDRHLISLSSGDDEFFSLKTLLIKENPTKPDDYWIDDIPSLTGSLWGSSFKIVRNGFPVNFNNAGASAPLDQIQGTIAALVAAICQARRYSANDFQSRIELDGNFQSWLHSRWIRHLPWAPQIERFEDLLRSGQLSAPRSKPQMIKDDPSFGEWTSHGQ